MRASPAFISSTETAPMDRRIQPRSPGTPKAPKGTTLEVPEIEDEKEQYPHQLFFNTTTKFLSKILFFSRY